MFGNFLDSPEKILGLQGLLNIAQAGLDYGADSAQSKAQRAWQEYSNKMTDLSASVSQNAVTTNQILAEDALTAQGLEIQSGGILTRAKLEAAAAGAGVKGKSINRGIRKAIGTASAREFERQERIKATLLAFEQQRKGIAISAAAQKDYSYIPRPKSAMYYLGALTKTVSYGIDKGIIG